MMKGKQKRQGPTLYSEEKGKFGGILKMIGKSQSGQNGKKNVFYVTGKFFSCAPPTPLKENLCRSLCKDLLSAEALAYLFTSCFSSLPIKCVPGH